MYFIFFFLEWWVGGWVVISFCVGLSSVYRTRFDERTQIHSEEIRFQLSRIEIMLSSFFFILKTCTLVDKCCTHTHTHTHTHTLSLSHTYNSDRKTMRDCYSARLQESERSKKKNTEFWVIHTLPIDKGWDSLIVVLFIYNPVTSPC